MELQLQHLSKCYGAKQAVDDVSTVLTPGVLQEPMATITDSINGKVWELLVSDREAAEYSRRFSVVNLHHENGNVRLRMIHDTSPAADAITVPPSLEDLFLYHFGEEAGEERGE